MEPKILQVSLFKVCKEERAEKFKAALQGKSYYNFRVLICPAGGCFEVWIETDYEGATEEEVKDMVIYILAGEIMK